MIEDPGNGKETVVQGDQQPPASVVAEQAISRRQLIAWLTGGSLVAASSLGLGQIAHFFSFQPVAEASVLISAGSPKDFAAESIAYNSQARAYVGRDNGGLYAIDAVCTHLGCLVERDADGAFVCPCHGSRFNPEGQVQKGPASKMLRHLRLQMAQDGQVVVDRAQEVPPSTRLAIPS